MTNYSPANGWTKMKNRVIALERELAVENARADALAAELAKEREIVSKLREEVRVASDIMRLRLAS